MVIRISVTMSKNAVTMILGQRLRSLFIVDEEVLAGVISLHQQLLMLLLPLMMLWSSVDW